MRSWALPVLLLAVVALCSPHPNPRTKKCVPWRCLEVEGEFSEKKKRKEDEFFFCPCRVSRLKKKIEKKIEKKRNPLRTSGASRR